MLAVGTGEHLRRIAYLHEPGAQPDAPGLLWLTGLKSDMISTKAQALAAWALTRGLAMTRFDYSGHGRSEGARPAPAPRPPRVQGLGWVEMKSKAGLSKTVTDPWGTEVRVVAR